MNHEKQNAILRFWFGEDPLKPLANMKMWFTKSDKTDSLIREKFEDMLGDASQGAFDDWSRTPDGALALVILLDQFPRNIYRGDERAFAYDDKALRAAQIAVAHQLDKRMSVIERCFLYLPYEHSEDLAIQERSIELYRDLENEAEGDEKRFIVEALDFAIRHHEIIEKFGRFPHRNELLGRESTRLEREFLKRPGSAF